MRLGTFVPGKPFAKPGWAGRSTNPSESPLPLLLFSWEPMGEAELRSPSSAPPIPAAQEVRNTAMRTP
jgi:hypothetical protein